MSNLLEINTNQKEIVFNFGGFYDSNHLTIIESNLDSTLDNIDSEKIKEFKKNDLFDFENTKINYAKALLKLIDSEFNTNFLECFLEVWSPKEYNFETDMIILDFQNFRLKDNETINKVGAFLKNIENYSDLEFEIAFFKLDSENLKKFIDNNLNLASEILSTILDNFENFKNQNFINFDEFKQYLIEASLFKRYIFRDAVNSNDEDLKIIFNLLENQ